MSMLCFGISYLFEQDKKPKVDEVRVPFSANISKGSKSCNYISWFPRLEEYYLGKIFLYRSIFLNIYYFLDSKRNQ